MAFSSKLQSKACFASGGFGGKVDCEEWAHKTDYKKLPRKKNFRDWLEHQGETEEEAIEVHLVNSALGRLDYALQQLDKAQRSASHYAAIDSASRAKDGVADAISQLNQLLKMPEHAPKLSQ